MSYLSVITLSEAKIYLRIDDDLTEDDANITRMINAALKYIEDYTNQYLFKREVTFLMVGNQERIYAHPINAVVSPTENLTVQRRNLYNIYCLSGSTTTNSTDDTTDLVLDVGFATASDVPETLREIGFEIIDILYYGKETGKTMADLDSLSVDILNQEKRFIL